MKAYFSLIFIVFLIFFACAGAGNKPCVYSGPVVRLAYKSKKPYPKVVYLAGNFNKWVIFDPDLRMRWDDIGKEFYIKISLKPGVYRYKFIVDGEWIVDPAAGKIVADKLGGRMGIFVVGK